MNPLQVLKVKVVGKWPTLPKNFNRKENTMQYMTNKMLQRFMSHMTETLNYIQICRNEVEEQIQWEKELFATQSTMAYWYRFRQLDKTRYVKNSKLQEHVRRGFIGHRTLQKMEKVVTTWIIDQQSQANYAYEQYLDNRYDPFYRNKSKQAKKKLAKLVELQQAIRKQKSITKD